jgi:hypothetical protein
MENVQNFDIYILTPTSQTYISYVIYFLDQRRLCLEIF